MRRRRRTARNICVWFASTKKNGLTGLEVDVIQHKHTEHANVSGKLGVEEEDEVGEVFLVRVGFPTLVSGNEGGELGLYEERVCCHECGEERFQGFL
jgi:hypothetical protein